MPPALAPAAAPCCRADEEGEEEEEEGAEQEEEELDETGKMPSKPMPGKNDRVPIMLPPPKAGSVGCLCWLLAQPWLLLLLLLPLAPPPLLLVSTVDDDDCVLYVAFNLGKLQAPPPPPLSAADTGSCGIGSSFNPFPRENTLWATLLRFFGGASAVPCPPATDILSGPLSTAPPAPDLGEPPEVELKLGLPLGLCCLAPPWATDASAAAAASITDAESRFLFLCCCCAPASPLEEDGDRDDTAIAVRSPCC